MKDREKAVEKDLKDGEKEDRKLRERQRKDEKKQRKADRKMDKDETSESSDSDMDETRRFDGHIQSSIQQREDAEMMDMKRMEKEGKRDKELKSADKLLWILIANL